MHYMVPPLEKAVNEQKQLADLSALEASVVTSVVSSPELYRKIDPAVLVPDGSAQFMDMVNYALKGHDALADKPDDYRHAVGGFIDSLREWVRARQREANQEQVNRYAAMTAGK